MDTNIKQYSTGTIYIILDAGTGEDCTCKLRNRKHDAIQFTIIYVHAYVIV
jgi:hypothetical protein